MEFREKPTGQDVLEPTSAQPGLPAVIDRAPQDSGIGTYLSQFFPQAGNLQGQAIGPLWFHASQALKSLGIHRHLPQALLTLIAMVSAHLNEALALFISADLGIDSTQFLDSVGSLIHEGLKVDFAGLTRKILSHNPLLVKGKAVIAYETNVTRPMQDILRSLLPSRSRASLIALVDQPEPKWLHNVPALRVNLEADPGYMQQEAERRAELEEDLTRIEGQTRILSKWFQGLTPNRVRVPYISQIAASLDQHDQMAALNLAWIEKIIKIVTIINGANYPGAKEMVAEYFALPSSAVGALGLTATKAEYYIFYRFAHDLFARGDSPMTTRQMRVFNAIKGGNLKFVTQGNTFMEAGATNAREIFQTLDYQERLQGWPSIDEIYETVNRDGGLTIDRPTVEREITALLNQGLILNRRDPALGHLHYRVTTLSIGGGSELPNPSGDSRPGP